MFSFSFHYRPQIIGLDISDHVIKAVELQRVKGGHALRAVSERGVPEGWIVDGEIREPSQVAHLISELVSRPLEGKFSSKVCVASLPEQRTFVKLISIDSFAPAEKQEAIRWAASQHIPFTLEEVELDSEPHPELSQGAKTAIVVGAAPKVLVESYTTALTAAGLKVVGLDLESTALARALAHSGNNATELIIDLGGNRTTVCVCFRGVVHLSSNLPFSGSDLTRTVSERLHLSLSEAEKAKHIFGLHPTRGHGRVRAALIPELNALVEKLREIIEFSRNHFPALSPFGQLTLTGGGSLLNGIDEILSSGLSLTCAKLDIPVHGRHSHSPLPRGLGARFSTAIGLALTSPTQQ